MNRDDRNMLEEEKRDLLTRLSEDKPFPSWRVMKRRLEQRLEEVEAELAGGQLEGPLMAHSTLTFSGDAVVGMSGMEPELAAEISKSYPALVEAERKKITRERFLENHRGVERKRQPRVSRSTTRFLLTAVAHGSFGLVFEEILPAGQPESLIGGPTPIREASEAAQKLLKNVLESDSPVQTLIEENLEIQMPVKSILIACQKSKVSLRMTQKYGETIEYTAQLINHVANLVQDIDEKQEVTQKYYGLLLGLLPNSLKFEFQPEQQDDILKGDCKFDYETATLFARSFVRETKCWAKIKTISQTKKSKVITTYELMAVARNQNDLPA